ncbi:MAG TPA: CDP-alcohol phosphatidyltransferase family protein [Phycisphaerae bacterium]|nr:CDP-alcohol phosphatidyltransferase family protein [Phycisphaerae bacterium]
MPAAHRLGWPNRITIVRMLLIGPFVTCLLNLNEPGRDWLRWLAVAIFALMGFSDFLDGFLARRLRSESPLGKFLDPLADKLFITAAVIILCVVGVRDTSDMQSHVSLTLPNWVAVAAIGKDLIVSIGFALVYLSTGRVFIRPRLPGKCCTAVQTLLVLVMLVWIDLPRWLSEAPRFLWWLATILAAVASIDYIVIGNRYVTAVAAEAKRQQNGEKRL